LAENAGVGMIFVNTHAIKLKTEVATPLNEAPNEGM
jgi:hypothetical protein